MRVIIDFEITATEEELPFIIAQLREKVEAQLERNTNLVLVCTAPESIDQLRNRNGQVVGSVKVPPPKRWVCSVCGDPVPEGTREDTRGQLTCSSPNCICF